jgi:drug/metabolite transporter (DMT)-like permease
LSITPAAVVAPFQYASIVWAVILGWLIWGDVPSLDVVLGSVIIVGSGLFVFYRERYRPIAARDGVEPVP